MNVAGIAVLAGVIFLWGAFSAQLERLHLTAAITFVAVGVFVSQVPGPLDDLRPSSELIKGLTELTLAVVLFTDAARVRFADLRADLALYVRLLAVGLPLTIALGTGTAYGLFPAHDIWTALLIGAALAPTDAALGSAVISNQIVPARIRRLINVESGLNDGIATPFVMLAIAGASSAGSEHHGPGTALIELALGVAIGVGIGGLGGELLRWTRRRGWLADDFAGPAVLALALCAYATAVAVEGNGFIAAFIGGAAFGNLSGHENKRLLPFVEEISGLASLIVWLVFGAIAVVPALEQMTWQAVIYALLSLTVLRMLPVALACVGSGLSGATVAFTGWFGPRGLASVIFALLALEQLAGETAKPVVTVITITVLLSVIAHGVTAGPLARRYGTHVGAETTAPEHTVVPELAPRELGHRER